MTFGTSGVYDPRYLQRMKFLFGSSIIGYYVGGEPVGSSVAIDDSGLGFDGAYTAVTLGQPGIGDGRTCQSYDGSTSKNTLPAGFRSAFSGAAGSYLVFAAVSAAGVWTDGTARYIVEVNVDNSNRVSILRSTTNNTMTLAYRGGNVLKQVSPGSLNSTGFIHYGLTWDTAADQVKAFLNGAQSGATVTGLTPYAGTTAVSLIGAQTATPISVWSGTIAHMLVLNRAATPSEVAAAAVI